MHGTWIDLVAVLSFVCTAFGGLALVSGDREGGKGLVVFGMIGTVLVLAIKTLS
ncbi:hypothetical protein [Methylobacterium brachythecii]|uniref:Uncharacterized protein n=1 Tax=Methylobacterium brachythecii TaxID=1176177 RepID=A0A7W6AIW3_9HYPH|nr:hypothetical protein [Methylobacterium brachythecii]MBB3904163.1 hypothetical protein [Methylobacterium brachythecii]GLS45175.1 hypothetical protein GCM10007884_31640 [Methylobacterium brachythecii]